MKKRLNFDYIIIGAGSAGCVLANRLSTDPANQVLLLEAGGPDRNPLIHVPGALLPLLLSGKQSWNYTSAPQKGLNDRVLFLPRGKVLGGGSSINGMVYDRGAASDYDSWEQTGNRGWSYSALLPYFRRSENFEHAVNEYHGSSGPVKIGRPGIHNLLAKAFVEAGVQAGYPFNDDTNGTSRLGFGPADMTISRGRRSSASRAYLRPIRSRPNLVVETGALAKKIIVESQRATGVSFQQDGHDYRAVAQREVIVCGGGIASPHLLMVSGIGDKEQLSEHGILSVRDLPGVGKNLQDHLSVYVKSRATKPVSLYTHTQPLHAAAAFAKYVLFRTGPLAGTGTEAIAYVKTQPDLLEPDAKLSFIPALMNDSMTGLLPEHGFMAHVCVLRPESRGEIRLASGDPVIKPIIDHNYLASENDRTALRNAIRVTRQIFFQKAFDEFRGEELQPGAAVSTDTEIDNFISANANADYHTSGTCKMGSDKNSVVDDRLRVHGIEGLRVADTSIMPTLVGGNTNMPAIMIGEKAADLILGQLGADPLQNAKAA